MPKALRIVQHFFPQVEKVVDGSKRITVHISEADAKRATRKNHNKCALAICTKEQEKADGVAVAISTVYVVKGNTAFRYKNLGSTAREIVSFDRNSGFEPGDYQLRPPSKGERLGEPHGWKRPSGRGGKAAPFKHYTTNIRTSLNTKGGAV